LHTRNLPKFSQKKDKFFTVEGFFNKEKRRDRRSHQDGAIKSENVKEVGHAWDFFCHRLRRLTQTKAQIKMRLRALPCRRKEKTK